MKNPEGQQLSIEKRLILELVAELWKKYPGVTFGQLTGSLAGSLPKTMLVFNRKTEMPEVRSIEPSIWSMDDKQILEILKGLYYEQGDI